MKAKITKGNGFAGVLRYVFDVGSGSTGKKFAEQIGGNMTSCDVAGLVQEFNIARNLRPEIVNPVFHLSLALPKNDRLPSAKWSEIAFDALSEMGFGPYQQWTATRHNDTFFDHIHIVASRIGLDGKVWDAGRDVFKAIAMTTALEKRHGLTLTVGRECDEDVRRPSANELNMSSRMNEAPPRLILQHAIDRVLAMPKSALVFCTELESVGIQAIPNLASTGKLHGFSFEYHGIHFKGSQLGKAFKLASLYSRGLTYDASSDFSSLSNWMKNTLISGDKENPEQNFQPASPQEPVKKTALRVKGVRKNSVSTTDLLMYGYQVQPSGIGFTYCFDARPAFIDHGEYIDFVGDPKMDIEALMRLASDKWSEVDIGGDENFAFLCVHAAAKHRLKITFSNPVLEHARKRLEVTFEVDPIPKAAPFETVSSKI